LAGKKETDLTKRKGTRKGKKKFWPGDAEQQTRSAPAPRERLPPFWGEKGLKHAKKDLSPGEGEEPSSKK